MKEIKERKEGDRGVCSGFVGRHHRSAIMTLMTHDRSVFTVELFQNLNTTKKRRRKMIGQQKRSTKKGRREEEERMVIFFT